MSAFGGKADIGQCPQCAPKQTFQLAKKVLFHSERVTRRAPIVRQLAALAIVQSGKKRIDDRAVSVLYSNLLMMGPTDLLELMFCDQDELQAEEVVLRSYSHRTGRLEA